MNLFEYSLLFISQWSEEPLWQFPEELGALPGRARGPKHHQPCWKRVKHITDLANLVFGDACMDEISWSYVWHKAAKGGSHHFGLSHLSTQRHKSVQNRFGDNDDAITSIVGRKSSIILGFGVSNIDNNLISAEKVLHGRGQFEGSTPMNKFSSCTEMEKGCTGCLSKRYFFDFWLTYTNQSFRMYCP